MGHLDLLDLWNTLKNLLHLFNLSIMDPELGNLAKLYFFAQLKCIPTHIPNDWIKNLNPDLDSPRCLLSKTHVDKILAISITCWNWIPLRSLLSYFHCFSGRDWKNENISKVATGKSNLNKFSILLRSFQGVFWIEDIQGYPNLD